MAAVHLIEYEGISYKITELTRVDWGGGSLRRGVTLDVHRFVRWFLHHTVMVMPDYDRDGFLHGDTDDIKRYMRHLQTVRPDLGSEVPYSWVGFRGESDRSAVVCEGRGRGRTGAHTEGYNSSSYAFSLAGNFDNEEMSPGMEVAFRWLAARETPWATEATRPHGAVAATACPGWQAKKSLIRLQPPFVPSTTTDNEEYDIMGVDIGELDTLLTNKLQALRDGAAWDSLAGALAAGRLEASMGAVRTTDGSIWTFVPIQSTNEAGEVVAGFGIVAYSLPGIQALQAGGVLPATITDLDAKQSAALRAEFPVVKRPPVG